MRILSLCSGIGGLDLGVRLAVRGARVVGYVERDDYCRRVLRARIAEGALDDAPIYEDVYDYRGATGEAEVITAGFPCQPWSCAGKRAGTSDSRWLWPEIARIIREVGPRYAFLENVPGLLSGGLGSVLGDLADCGFDAEWGSVSAAEVGAPHLRKRIFVLAYARSQGLEGGILASYGGGDPFERRAPLADACGQRLAIGGISDARDQCEAPERSGDVVGGWPPGPGDADGWSVYLAASPRLEPAVCRGAPGTGNRVERLRALGNVVVPAQAARAFRVLYGRLTHAP